MSWLGSAREPKTATRKAAATMHKILILDDDPQVLKCIQVALDAKGCQTFTTTDFNLFFTLFNEQAINLVILDICMPGKNGFEVFKELCKGKHPPVLFITAYSGSFSSESKMVMDLWKNEFSDGNTDILYKPFTLDLLYTKVESLIGTL